jgi:bacillithiol biosynthesis cysteine-adding enzyme BshC
VRSVSSAVPLSEPRASFDLAIHATPLAGGTLLRDYLGGTSLSPFYTGHPGDPAAFRRKAAEVDARLDAVARMRVHDAIECFGDAAPRVQRILNGDGYFITTGQQPALFGGPLYTLYKVLAAIRLAGAVEAQLGKPVIALFWNGADDHDWDEANHTHVIDEHDYVQRLEVSAPENAPPLALSERMWGPGVQPAIDEFIRTLPDTAWSRDIAAHVSEAYRPDATVADSFAATMRLLLRDRRVAMVSSAHPAVRRAASPVLRHEALHAQEHAQLIAAQTRRLESAGYRAQVTVDADAANIMLHDANGRDRLARTRNGWITRRDRRAFSDDALQQLLAGQPEQFSPNVFLRPVVESAVFPTLAYVGGPAEIAYFAQIGCLFAAHGMLPPIAVPRCSVLLVEPAIGRAVQRLQLPLQSFAQPFDQLFTAVARAEIPADVRAALDRTRETLLREYASLADAAAGLDPTMRGPIDTARNAALNRLHHAEKKIVRQLKRNQRVLAEQLRRAAAHIRPTGAPQERMISPLHFLARYGPELMVRVEAALDMTPAAAAHWEGPECP